MLMLSHFSSLLRKSQSAELWEMSISSNTPGVFLIFIFLAHSWFSKNCEHLMGEFAFKKKKCPQPALACGHFSFVPLRFLNKRFSVCGLLWRQSQALRAQFCAVYGEERMLGLRGWFGEKKYQSPVFLLSSFHADGGKGARTFSAGS